MGETMECGPRGLSAAVAGRRWSSRSICRGRYTVWRETQCWSGPTTSVPDVRERRFFPLDQKLQLREDHWSDGAAQVAARQGLQAASFERAAEAYEEAVGGSISRSSVRRVTQGFGQRLSEQKEREAEQASAIATVEESPQDRRVPLQDPIVEKGNVSSDGTMILLRGEGWKEVKMAAFSEVEVLEAGSQKRRSAQREGKRAGEEVVRLQGHSYCAGVWDADTFEQYQYAEGLRRGLDLLEQLSSVNDGALWIERTTFTNFPEARQVIDWGHALERLWAVAHAVYGEGETAKEWLKPREGALWDGKVEQVIEALEALNLDQPGYPDEVRQAPGYFRHNRDRMRYDVFRALGYPIGSGTVESGAKNVVKHRMRRPGRGWKRGCAQAMLAGLSELHSGRFDWAWQQVYRRAA